MTLQNDSKITPEASLAKNQAVMLKIYLKLFSLFSLKFFAMLPAHTHFFLDFPTVTLNES